MSENRIVDPGGVGEPCLGEAAWCHLLSTLLRSPENDRKRRSRELGREIPSEALWQAVESYMQTSEGDYLAVLGPGGIVSPREVAYRGWEDPGRILADLSAFYEAFGFEPDPTEPPDHAAVEIDFLGFLYLKSAYAQMTEEQQLMDRVSAAFAEFQESHLNGFIEPLASRLCTTQVECMEKMGEVLQDWSRTHLSTLVRIRK